MFDKLKQLKDLKEQAKQLEQNLAEEKVIVKSADGQVSLEMDGNQQLVSVEINPDLLAPEQKETLQADLKEAHDLGIKKIKTVIARKMYSSGMNLPGM